MILKIPRRSYRVLRETGETYVITLLPISGGEVLVLPRRGRGRPVRARADFIKPFRRHRELSDYLELSGYDATWKWAACIHYLPGYLYRLRRIG